MSRGIRVRFLPSTTGPPGPVRVSGGEVDLEAFGAGTAKAERDQPKPAKLIFHGAYLDRARGVSAPEFVRIATLSGSIALRGAPPSPVFTCDAEADFEYEEPEPENGEPFRELRMSYSPTSFRNAPEDGAPSTRLRLPLEPDGARFFELGAELEIDGDTEAPLPSDHRLDVPLGPRPGPIFEWPEELTEQLPDGLTLTLEEDGKRVALDWAQGEVVGGFRRFSFAGLGGQTPCTLTAQAGKQKLTLLQDQVISDPSSAIRWDHLLEELTLTEPAPEDSSVTFESAPDDVPRADQA